MPMVLLLPTDSARLPDCWLCSWSLVKQITSLVGLLA